MTSELTSRDFHVGWICALDIEYVAACEVLDEEYEDLPQLPPNDHNIYTCGRIGRHNVTIACLPEGRYGIASVATVAAAMLRSFPAICIRLLVGIGGGAPNSNHDVRLGDVVVSTPSGRTGGVVHYEFGKTIQNQQFEFTGFLNSPPLVLLNAVQKMSMLRARGKNEIGSFVRALLQKNSKLKKYARPGKQTDILFHSDFLHPDKEQNCDLCMYHSEKIVDRLPRDPDADEVDVHHGLIASADRLMKDADVRDRLAKTEGVICFEMEAAGLMNHFSCLVIRGICDYSDTHKNKIWQGYAAMTAAAYATQLLKIMPDFEVDHVLQDIRQAMAQSESFLSQRMQEESLTITTCIRNDLDSVHDHLSTSIQNSRTAGLELETRQRFLGSLRFQDMNLRFNDVEASMAQTFEWIFAPDSSASLKEWLQGEDGLFWVRGKAGSGKSTFMKFILQNAETHKALHAWQPSAENPVRVLKHFFWLSGTINQRNTKGFLSSLVFQMLQENQELLNKLLRNKTYSAKESLEDWSKQELTSILSLGFDTISQPYCIFVDALDEMDACEGPHEVLAILQTLQMKPNIKLCVSSRPDQIFLHKFSAVNQIKLEDLTRADMQACIREHFRQFRADGTWNMTHHDWSMLENELQERAHGVFIWLRLALKSITEGLYDLDQADELWRRLNLLPPEIDELYALMWKRKNLQLSSHKYEAALYFRLMLAINILGQRSAFSLSKWEDCTSLDLMIAADYQAVHNPQESPITQASDLVQACAKFESRLTARTAGLVEFQESSSDAKSTFLPTRRLGSTEHSMLNKRPVFMHRTVRDFLTSSEGGSAILSWCSESDCELGVRFTLAYLSTLQLGFRDLETIHIRRCLGRAGVFPDAQSKFQFVKLLDTVSRELFVTKTNILEPEDWFFYLQLIEAYEWDHHEKSAYGLHVEIACRSATSYFECIPIPIGLKFDQTYLNELLSIATEGEDWSEDFANWLLEKGADPCARPVGWRKSQWPTAFATMLISILARGEKDVGVTKRLALVQRSLDRCPDLSEMNFVLLDCKYAISSNLSLAHGVGGKHAKPEDQDSLLAKMNVAELLRLATDVRHLGLVYPASSSMPSARPWRSVLAYDVVGDEFNENGDVDWISLPVQESSEVTISYWDQWFSLYAHVVSGNSTSVIDRSLDSASKAFSHHLYTMRKKSSIRPTKMSCQICEFNPMPDMKDWLWIQPFSPPTSYKNIQEAIEIGKGLRECRRQSGQ